MIHNLVPITDPILKTYIDEFDFSNPPIDPFQLAVDLSETMIYNNGIGLAANQIGLPYRAFAMTGSPIHVCFNPRILDQTTEQVLLEEGCLSYPGLKVKIKRPKSIRVRFTKANGETVTEKFTGITARVFQHEFDHLNGEIFFNRANLFHKEQGFRQWRNNK